MREKAEAPHIRCGECNRLLGKGAALDLSIKCPRCGCINHIMSGPPARLEGFKPHNEALHVDSQEKTR